MTQKNLKVKKEKIYSTFLYFALIELLYYCNFNIFIVFKILGSICVLLNRFGVISLNSLNVRVIRFENRWVFADIEYVLCEIRKMFTTP